MAVESFVWKGLNLGIAPSFWMAIWIFILNTMRVCLTGSVCVLEEEKGYVGAED